MNVSNAIKAVVASAFVVSCGAANLPGNATKPEPLIVTVDGVGEYRINGSLDAKIPRNVISGGPEDLLVLGLSPEDVFPCSYAYVETELGPLHIMLIGDEVARIETSDQRLKLANGLGVGSTGADIVSVYGDRALSHRNFYVYEYIDYMVKLSETVGLYFHLGDDGKVFHYRVGRFPELEWVEGCA